MIRQRLLNAVAGAGLLLVVLEFSALQFNLYWRLWWLDIPMHLLGGVFVSLLLLWFFFFSGYVRVPLVSSRVFFLYMIGGAFLVGTWWEILEASFGVGGGFGGYWFDTIKDICMDVLGALAAYLFMRRRL